MNLIWSVAPALILLAYYYRRLSRRLVLLQTFGFFCLGILSGVVALAVGWRIETTLIEFGNWETLTLTFVGVVIRQFLVVAPVEELCKFLAFIIPIYLFRWRFGNHKPEIFLFAIALCLGFTAHENWVFLSNDNATPFDRIISTPVHAMFAAPWIYIITKNLTNLANLANLTNLTNLTNKYQLLSAWLNCVACHALINIFANAGAFTIPIRYLSYCLFPCLLYLFWRMERLLKLAEVRKIKYLLKYFPIPHRYWRLGLILFALSLGGNALLGIFITIRTIIPLPIVKIWEFSTITLLTGRILYNITFGLIAWGIYYYLQKTARNQ